MVRRIAEVAVNVPLSKSFHYSVPDELQAQIERGHRVLIPFGPRTTTGVCVDFPDESEHAKLKPIRELLHPDCRFDEHLLELTRWIASYYQLGWGEVLEAALPPAIRSGKTERRRREIVAVASRAEMETEAERRESRAAAQARVLRALATHGGEPPRCDRGELLRQAATTGATLARLIEAGWLCEESVADRRDPYATDGDDPPGREEPVLNADQQTAVDAIHELIAADGFAAVLLRGITGSGKTEVYIRALREVLAAGGRGLVLLPEIALTPQTVLRFREALPDTPVAVLHSMLSPNERTGQWRDIQAGEARLVIGARSAIFAPIPDLRLIVVDEEHEPSYKQESSPRYHARDIAVKRASMLGVPIVLGSATPSLESWHNAQSGKYRLIELPRRATPHDLPSVHLIPLDQNFYKPDGSGLVSPKLDYQIRRQLADGEQTLLFLNRRGFSTYVHCPQCGYVERCEECDVSMTLHRGVGVVRCHYCGRARPAPTDCPDCNSPRIRRSGVGTEKVVAELGRRYPQARVLRLDRDAITTHRSLREALSGFARGEHDILVGTQMVAKGHDFPKVSLVGVLSADTGLHFPDFRAAERTYQLITQVSGRAGRGARRGRVMVQTFAPEHYAIARAADGDWPAFCATELENRRALGYPPFGRLVKVQLSGTDEKKVRAMGQRLGARLNEAARALAPADETGGSVGILAARLGGDGVQVLGPCAAPIARLQGRYRAQILLKSRHGNALRRVVRGVADDLKRRGAVDGAIDVDPQSLM